MVNESEIRRHVQNFLDDKLSLEDLADWSASASWDIHKSSAPDVQGLLYSIRAVLNDVPSDQVNVLRRELAKTVRPFAPRTEVASVAVYVRPHMTIGEPMILSGNNSVHLFRERPRRYIRVLDAKAEGRTHSAYTYAPMGSAYGFGHPLEDPDLATQALPLHAEPA